MTRHAGSQCAISDEETIARLDDYVKVKFQAEDLEALPARDVLDHFEGIGLPNYAVLRLKQPGEGAG